ncbi:MAG: peptidoglycan binding domain-containing protein, partial [Chloroflexota bacterium]|nr:peptidoglycan binding domain-containing protein [Chloroflexota bacterium]
MQREIEEWRQATRTRVDPLRAERRSFGRLPAVLLVLAAVGALLLGVGWLVGSMYHNRIYPQVVAANIPLGSLTPDEAEAKLTAGLQPYLDSPVVLQLGRTTWRPSAEELGLSVDVRATVGRAVRAGRDESAALAVLSTLLRRDRPVEVPVVTVLDPAILQRYLGDIGAQVNRDVTNPALRVTGGTVSIEGGEPGYTFLLEETQAALLGALRSMSPGPVAIRVHTEHGPVTPEEVARAEDRARRIISAPLRLQAETRSWEISR